MTAATKVQEPSSIDQPLDALDLELPFLAANAALELDKVLNDSTPSFSYVEKLARMLQLSTHSQGAAGGDLRLLVDPVSTTVLTRAILESRQSSVHSLQELAKETSEVSDFLMQIRNSTLKQKDVIKTLRDFCVALSRLASASRKTIYGEEPAHQYRR